MFYVDAKKQCCVRSAIFRSINPDIKYWKNHPVPMDERVPSEDKVMDDWEEYDPRDSDNCSLFMFND